MQLNKLILHLSLVLVSVVSFSHGLGFDDAGDAIPSETSGACSAQLSPQLHKRNCRYGKLDFKVF